MNALTPEDLARVYGDGWRFGVYDATWVGVAPDGTRYEADDALSLVCAITQGRSVS